MQYVPVGGHLRGENKGAFVFVKRLFVLVTLLSLTACAVQPAKMAPVDYVYEPPVKIGFVSMISERPTHQHTGYTVFGNFVRDLDVKWQLNDYIFTTLAQTFKQQKGYELVNLSADPAAVRLFDNDNLVRVEGEIANANPQELQSIVNALNEPDLDAIVVVRSLKVFYNKNLEVIKSSMGEPGDHGFKSQAGVGMTFNSAIGINFFSVAPKAHYVGWQYLGLIGQPVSPEPADYENLTEQELKSYEKQLKDNIKLKLQSFVGLAPGIAP
ncbi:hypothetical protein [Alteromonas lipolytica]|uniref:Uncharacterized protein n=1 Tax=Alteromonas lipolytica TaxID=1856405 RepID=A0A1E8FIG0_9ALTE|nr:hypothetical protein [Alteromonas lipolytica]OFI35737.1 hypothetical protein BFC17_10645 [Alteromonas lipolytica]GGF80348.1 hypothetical protein GCM10011338_35770 [Alteromonas lipolytica]